METRVVWRRMDIRRGGKGVVQKVRIVVMEMRSRVIEMCAKDDYVECMAEKRTCRNGINEGLGVRGSTEQQNVK
jgi:hypothetical protein